MRTNRGELTQSLLHRSQPSVASDRSPKAGRKVGQLHSESEERFQLSFGWGPWLGEAGGGQQGGLGDWFGKHT